MHLTMYLCEILKNGHGRFNHLYNLYTLVSEPAGSAAFNGFTPVRIYKIQA